MIINFKCTEWSFCHIYKITINIALRAHKLNTNDLTVTKRGAIVSLKDKRELRNKI